MSRVLLLLLLLLPEVGLVGQLMVLILGRGVVVLVERFLVNRRIPVDGQLRHDGLISGTLCVEAHVVIGHHILSLRVLLTGLVPGRERRRERGRRRTVKERRR